ncbi:Cys-rich protein [Leptospira langatensis]|uniref:Cys-rich protein n=1 Tax=Leptospira langatensis TaxID=2484983 RepID=A0A5F1ZPG4_9LEPT|nr:Cys-rich protein [Leptospira langatensis]TGK01763.1 Cys-rich protein [Leptospira langatensis]TGL39369.1 Cys-rich protein [Leptospira langatensis]
MKQISFRKFFPYLPIFLLGLAVGTFIAFKYSRSSVSHSNLDWEGKEICLDYCDNLAKCTKKELPQSSEDQLYKIENSCLRGCRKHFDKMQVCLQPEKMASCSELTACLFGELKKYY